ncbi:acyl carrier protein [uncultured Shewanella sp.]|uniref:acyl carrier protein n=1 Tax=uncultured Shewanella sp. TaxID=173975 RepID=UPI0026166544|nr:acyl carrier protein [uncultured Shewanella sp.]
MSEQFSGENMEAWLVSYLGRMLDKKEEDIDVDASFDTFGLESSSIAAMTGDLSDWLGQEIDPTIVYEHPSISSLTQQITRLHRREIRGVIE